MTKRKIKAFRKIVLPFISKHLLDIDYEGQGKCDAEEFEKDFNEILDLAYKALEQEPKVGHWTEKGHNFEKCWAECSVCGKTASGHSKDTGWGFTYSYTDYCPNCGAKMESEAAE